MAVITSPALEKSRFDTPPSKVHSIQPIDDDMSVNESHSTNGNSAAPQSDSLLNDPSARRDDAAAFSATPTDVPSELQSTMNGKSTGASDASLSTGKNETHDMSIDNITPKEAAPAHTPMPATTIGTDDNNNLERPTALLALSDTLGSSSLPAPVQAPTSDLRDEPSTLTKSDPTPDNSDAPLTKADATNGLPQSKENNVDPDAMDTTEDAPTVLIPEQAAQNNGDAMDVEPPVETRAAPTAAESSAPQNDKSVGDNVGEENTLSAHDDEMVTSDAPSSAGRVRPRDEDGEDAEPLAKRTKTVEEPLQQGTDFKVPDAPAVVPTTTPAPTAAPAPTPAAAAANNGAIGAPGLGLAQGVVPKKLFDSSPMTSVQRKYMLDKIRTSKKVKSAIHFLAPVDYLLLNIPTYPTIIKNPMDLSTVERKLKEELYGSVDDVVADFDLMIQNCFTFNGPQHVVSIEAQNLNAYFKRALDHLPPASAPDPQPYVKKPKKPIVSTSAKPRRESRTSLPGPAKSPPAPVSAVAPTPTASVSAASPSTAFALQPDGMPLIRRDSTNTDRPKREIHRPPPKDLPYSVKPRKKKNQLEIKFCGNVLDQVMSSKHNRINQPFMVPVDPVALNIPNYHNIIKKPMDLSTVNKRLKGGEYQGTKDFKADVDLVFGNCFKFNVPGDYVYSVGQELQKVLEDLWANKQQWIDDHTPVSEPHSPASADSDDEEDASEEEMDEKQRALLAIQQKIVALNDEAAAIIQGEIKKPSPKPGKKAKGTKSGNLGKSKKAAVAPSKSSSKVKAKPKTQALSYAQKEEISQGISTLGENEMRKALQIIRNGVPAMQDMDDDEVEVDMAAIPEDTLRELLKLVRSVRPSKHVVEEEYSPPPRPSKAHPSELGGRKKNKPMGKKEQEENISRIKEQLKTFQAGATGAGAGDDAIADGDESSDDDESVEESEEE